MEPKSVDLKKYVGRPYDKYNCFDLVKEFYLDNFGVDLKNYFEGGPVPDRKEVECLIVSNKGDFIKVEGKPQFGDIVVISLYGFECHVGVCVDNRVFLHSSRGAGSNLERLARYEKIIAGYYRHRGHE